MLGRVFTIGALFAMVRQVNRSTKLDELRAGARAQADQQHHMTEQVARKRNLDQMRAQSNAQLEMSLADSGVNPMLTMGGNIQAAHIQRAAVNNSQRRR